MRLCYSYRRAHNVRTERWIGYISVVRNGNVTPRSSIFEGPSARDARVKNEDLDWGAKVVELHALKSMNWKRMPTAVYDLWASYFGEVKADPSHPAVKDARRRGKEADREAGIEGQRTSGAKLTTPVKNEEYTDGLGDADLLERFFDYTIAIGHSKKSLRRVAILIQEAHGLDEAPPSRLLGKIRSRATSYNTTWDDSLLFYDNAWVQWKTEVSESKRYESVEGPVSGETSQEFWDDGLGGTYETYVEASFTCSMAHGQKVIAAQHGSATLSQPPLFARWPFPVSGFRVTLR
jgi:hypothetical protein